MLLSRSKNLLVVGIVLICQVAFAGYYKPDFFPIGLTGLNYTGSGTPYGNVGPYWGWDESVNEDYNEKALIEELGVNCIGCEPANSPYIGSFDTTVCRNQNNYLYKVYIPSFLDDGDSTNPEHIYIIEFIDITELIDDLIADSLPGSLDLED